MAKIIEDRMTSDHRGSIVVFLIGMRINRLWAPWRWVPVFLAMPGMLRELLTDPASGCRGARTYLSGRTFLVVQHWDSVEQLLGYAHDTESKHRPAWQAFNRRAAKSSAVGIFHETYAVPAGGCESVYRAMPPFGLAAATDSLVPVGHRGGLARDRSPRLGAASVAG